MFSSGVLSWWHIAFFIFSVLFIMYLAEKSKSKFLKFIACLEMVAVAGLRHGYIDTRAYRNGFEYLNISETLNLDFVFNGKVKDRGFYVLSALIKIILNDSQFFLFILALITVGFLFYGIMNNTHDTMLAVFLFICTGCYLDTMNGIRQCLVSAILFFFLPKFIKNNNFKGYFILVLILSTIHGSALLMLPLYFVAGKKAWSKTTWYLSFVTLLVFLFFNLGIGSAIVDLLDGTTYGNDYGEMISAGNTSANFIRVFVAFAPIALSFFYRNNDEKNFQMYNISFNMSLINALTWLFATKVLYFYRLAMYFQPYMILLICFELYYIKDEKEKRIVNFSIVSLFLIWHIYSLYVMGNQFFVGYLKY